MVADGIVFVVLHSSSSIVECSIYCNFFCVGHGIDIVFCSLWYRPCGVA